jgi:hypothetical protein
MGQFTPQALRNLSENVKSTAANPVLFTFLVGARGFEPPASWSRTKRATKLRYAPFLYHDYSIEHFKRQ